jgi:hypothetical protein
LIIIKYMDMTQKYIKHSKLVANTLLAIKDFQNFVKYQLTPYCDLSNLSNWRNLLVDSMINNKPNCLTLNIRVVTNILVSKHHNTTFFNFSPKPPVPVIREHIPNGKKSEIMESDVVCGKHFNSFDNSLINNSGKQVGEFYNIILERSKVFMFHSEIIRYILPKSGYLRALEINLESVKAFEECLSKSIFCRFDLLRIIPSYLLSVRVLTPKRFPNFNKESKFLKTIDIVIQRPIYKLIYDKVTTLNCGDKYDDKIIEFIMELDPSGETLRHIHNDITLLLDRARSVRADYIATKEDTMNKRAVWRVLIGLAGSGTMVFLMSKLFSRV